MKTEREKERLKENILPETVKAREPQDRRRKVDEEPRRRTDRPEKGQRERELES